MFYDLLPNAQKKITLWRLSFFHDIDNINNHRVGWARTILHKS